jgi:hypothetical protein
VSERFDFEVPVYSQKVVIRLLDNYVKIRSTMIDRMPEPRKPIYLKDRYTYQEKPLGASAATPWPFMTRPRAQQITDGKKRARMMEDLHVATLDLECALNRLSDDDYHLIADYYLFGNGTLDELATARGLASKGRLHERIQRIVQRLVRSMNNGV